MTGHYEVCSVVVMVKNKLTDILAGPNDAKATVKRYPSLQAPEGYVMKPDEGGRWYIVSWAHGRVVVHGHVRQGWAESQPRGHELARLSTAVPTATRDRMNKLYSKQEGGVSQVIRDLIEAHLSTVKE